MRYVASAPEIIQRLIWLPTRIALLVFCSVRIVGAENIRKLQGNVIIATNHISEVDPLIIVSAMPFNSSLLPLLFVAREKMHYKTKWKGIRRLLYGGILFRLAGSREAYTGIKDYERALRNHLIAIEKGMSVCIFPVGRLHDTDEYKNARGGVAYLAARTGRQILPINIDGIIRTTTLRDILQRRTKVTITLGEPIEAAELFTQPVYEVTPKSQRACERAAVKLMIRINSLRPVRASQFDPEKSHGSNFETDLGAESP